MKRYVTGEGSFQVLFYLRLVLFIHTCCQYTTVYLFPDGAVHHRLWFNDLERAIRMPLYWAIRPLPHSVSILHSPLTGSCHIAPIIGARMILTKGFSDQH